jgi:hypothetical protein
MDTTKTPTTPTVLVATAYLNALRVQKQAEEAVAKAKEALLATYAEAGVNAESVDGKTVTATEATRRNFDAEALEALVSYATFRAVTKVSVEPKAWDKAKKAGEVTDEVESQIVTPTTYVRINVTDEVVATAEAEAV